VEVAQRGPRLRWPAWTAGAGCAGEAARLLVRPDSVAYYILLVTDVRGLGHGPPGGGDRPISCPDAARCHPNPTRPRTTSCWRPC